MESGLEAETVGAGLKLIQGIIPSDSSLAIDTSTTAGKVKSVGVNVALEAVDSLGDPVKIATELFNSATNAPLPSADITQEEIDILKSQHITNGVLDQTIARVDQENAVRRGKLVVLEKEIRDLQLEVNLWEAKEKDRVAFEIVEGCKAQR
ncbi:MAG: hypothetical protein RLZZ69_1686 [Cyanobacteriota bacterium]